MAGFRDRLRGVVDRVASRAGDVGPGVRLARLHGGAFRAWLRYRQAVAEGIGPVEAELYSAFVVRVAEVDGDLARVLALAVPDQIARVPADLRPRYFAALDYALASRAQALPLVARSLPELLGQLDDAALQRFLDHGLDLHAVSHQKAESFLRQESGAGQVAARELQKGVALRDVSRTLTMYARAHCGADVQVRGGEGRAFTDGHHLYLPEVIDRFGDERDFAQYRVQTAMGAGYLEFGTFELELDRVGTGFPDRRDGEGELERYFRSFPNRVIARDLFQVMEDARVEARIRREYPGIARDLDAIGPGYRGERPEPDAPAARVIEVLARRTWGLPELSLSPEQEASLAPLSALLPTLAEADVHAVAAAVRAAFPLVEALMKRAEEGPPPKSQGGDRRAPRNPEEEASQFQPPPAQTRIAPEEAGPQERSLEERVRELREKLRQDGEDLSAREARQRLAEAQKNEQTRFAKMEQMLDRQELTGGALVDPERERDDTPIAVKEGLQVDPDAIPVGRAWVYREWDASIEDYKPRWTVVREQRLKEGSSAFVDEVMTRERHRIDALRRKFEAMRPRGMVKKRALPDGAELDLDRVVEAHVDRRVTGSFSERIYQETRPERREVAIAFLLDMSSSTNESAAGGTRRIIEVEKEALIVIAEAIHAIGDPFAIWGFSGYGRDHVAFYLAKDFRDPYDDRVRQRIGRMSFKMENRDGAAIRHATARLMQEPARARILMLLSDGKPLDCGCDHYYDRYAQEDTRAALREARQVGIHPFCITVDPSGPAYLPRMYGEVAYTVIDRIDALPAQIVRVYRRLAL